jgi:hypothetical protein
LIIEAGVTPCLFYLKHNQTKVFDMALYKFSQALRNESLAPAGKYAAFQDFKIYFDGLCEESLKSTDFTDDQLAQNIFKQKWKSSQDDLMLKKLLFAVKNTLSRYAKLINEDNFSQFNYVLKMLAFDMYGVIRDAELKYRNTELKFKMGTRPDQNAREIFDVSEGILHIGTIDPSTAYLREVIPVSIFLLRQTIEVFGKKALGFHSINYHDGTRVRISTQIAWDFFKKETSKKASRVTLPANIDTIIKVEEWTNLYVHTGYIPEIFLIENAVHFVKSLIYPVNHIRDFNGSAKIYGTTQIRDYNQLKKAFEDFINLDPNIHFLKRIWNNVLVSLRFKKKRKLRIVNWVDVSRVDATIINL